MSQRSMHGAADRTGETTGTLRVFEMIARRPEPRYRAVCTRCSTEQTISQRDIINGTGCRNSGCGKEALREELAETPRKYAQRLQRQETERIDAIAAEFQEKTRKIALLERDQVAKGYDDQFDLMRIDPTCANVSMSAAQADAFNAEQYRLFHAETPDWYASRSNIDTMQEYLSRNGCSSIVSKVMLAAAFRRLDTYGLLDHRPVPEAARQTAAPPNVDVRPAPVQPKRRESEEGYDLRTGERRMFTPYEIDRMSADEYRRVFRVYKSDLVLPNHAAF